MRVLSIPPFPGILLHQSLPRDPGEPISCPNPDHASALANRKRWSVSRGMQHLPAGHVKWLGHVAGLGHVLLHYREDW